MTAAATGPAPPRAFWPVAVATLALVAIAHALQRRYGFGAWDEGYLWYGAQATLRGEVPIRDFMAYDVGRYWWAAGWMRALGADGELALRLATAAFQALGLLAGAWCLVRARLSPAMALSGLVALLAWSWPWFRAYDCAAAVILLWSAAWALDAPTPRRAFVAGLVLGAMALVGRNHGLYGGVALVAALATGWPSGRRLRGLALLAAGTACGFAPMIVLFAADAGFRAAYIADNLALFTAGATNIGLAVPWPHRAFAEPGTAFEIARKVFIGAYFVAIPAFVLGGAFRLWRLGPARWRTHPVFAAAVLLALPYAHFAFSRADPSHLANGIAPVLLGLFAWPRSGAARAWPHATVAALVLATSLVVMAPLHPGVAGRWSGDWVEREVAGERLRVAPSTAHQLDLVARLVEGIEPGSRQVLIAPYWVGMYPAFGLRSPVWEIYALAPQGEAFERAEIGRLDAAGTRLAIVQRNALDGREELGYANTHPRLYAHLQREFALVEQTPTLEVRRRGPGRAP
jgi:hypothetical protein